MKKSNCLYCDTEFDYRSNKIFCSRSCKVKYRKYPWRSHKGDSCSSCGFIPEHKCQLDVDHIDGDKSNNSPENLQTLCANCHRIKTHNNKEYLNKSYRTIK